MTVVAASLWLLLFGMDAEAQLCPPGSFPWIDNWGSWICTGSGVGSGGATTWTDGRLNPCPTGSQPRTDSWGNRICQPFGSRQQFYELPSSVIRDD